jgi:hypothetical protein
MSIDTKLFIAAIALGFAGLVSMVFAMGAAFESSSSSANRLAIIGSSLLLAAGLLGLVAGGLAVRTAITQKVFRWWIPLAVPGALWVLWCGSKILLGFYESWPHWTY